MRRCWICTKEYDTLSKEHIIPKFFGGRVRTENFSCEECNQTVGRHEQKLNGLSVFMHFLDNAEGKPEITGQQRGSRNKETKMSYGDDRSIQLSSSGVIKSKGWESPPDRDTIGNRIWILTQIPLGAEVEVLHKSMLKAITALACHCGFSRDFLEAPLEYLAGNHPSLDALRPIDLGLPPQEMFATVWIFTPPSDRAKTVYAAATYGPISYLYSLRSNLRQDFVPFFCEVKAYSREILVGIGEVNYRRWWTTTLERIRQQSKSMQAYRAGPFTVKPSEQSYLSVVETSPAWWISGYPDFFVPVHPLEPTHGLGVRFERWLRSLWSEENHSRFLFQVSILDSATAKF